MVAITKQIVLLSDGYRSFRFHPPMRWEFFAWERLKIYELSGDGRAKGGRDGIRG